jgi:hypothetical protein
MDDGLVCFGSAQPLVLSSSSAHEKFVTQLLAVDMDETRTVYCLQLLFQDLPVVIIIVLQALHQFNPIPRQPMVINLLLPEGQFHSEVLKCSSQKMSQDMQVINHLSLE